MKPFYQRLLIAFGAATCALATTSASSQSAARLDSDRSGEVLGRAAIPVGDCAGLVDL